MKVENLSFAYGKSTIFEKLSFKAEPGQILMVLGVNGAGKSTLMKCLAGVLKPNSGKIILDGGKNDKIGYLTQNILSNNALTVFEFVLLGRIGELGFRVSDEDISRVEEVLEQVRITQFAERYFDELSGGQQRLVLIAQMFARHPNILFLDEPTANLDLLHQRRILTLIRNYTDERQALTIINIHNMNHAFGFGDRILLLENGGIGFLGEAEDLGIDSLSRVFGVDFEWVTNRNGQKIIIDV